MAEKLNAENIEAAVQHLENIQTGKTPILSELKGNIKEKEKKVFPLIPPNDPRLLMQVAPFLDDTLEQFGFADRKELSKRLRNWSRNGCFDQIPIAKRLHHSRDRN